MAVTLVNVSSSLPRNRLVSSNLSLLLKPPRQTSRSTSWLSSLPAWDSTQSSWLCAATSKALTSSLAPRTSTLKELPTCSYEMSGSTMASTPRKPHFWSGQNYPKGLKMPEPLGKFWLLSKILAGFIAILASTKTSSFYILFFIVFVRSRPKQ